MAKKLDSFLTQFGKERSRVRMFLLLYTEKKKVLKFFFAILNSNLG